MSVIIHLFFIIGSQFLLTWATNDDVDYDPDYRNSLLDADRETRELLIRELLLNRFGRLLLQQQQPLFTYKFPAPQADETFAVSPSDPRYYLPNAYEEQEKFLRHIKADDSAILDKSYKGYNDAEDDTVNDDIDSNNNDKINESFEMAKENHQPLQQQRTVLSVPTSVPLAVQVIKTPLGDFETTRDDMIFIAIVAGCSAAAVLIVAGIGFGWYRLSLQHAALREVVYPDLCWGLEKDFKTLGWLHKKAKAAADVDYPAYGVTGPNKEISPNGDRKLAESAQMYHYQHQKQQIISMSRASNEHRGSGSEAESDEENEEGDYTVYECPGLAAAGEMEVKNPLFQDDPTPAGNNQNTICPSSPGGDQKTEKHCTK
ncbi:uncharacterized protein LOC142328712 isoform X2 [Lycorma delicatula]|uniref:uncharacterized protein LOC142328712 isoform X2 n=1 Tax=Lycorma delicatula TaxID=130591 RepID=UPI003F50E76E